MPEDHLRQSVHRFLGLYWFIACINPDGKAKKKLIEEGVQDAAILDCQECGECLTFSVAPGLKKIVAESKCKYPKGVPEIVVNLEVPSGEILLLNDFREIYKKPEYRLSLNTNAGVKQYTELYAKQGLITHFVGDRSVTVLQTSKEELLIGCAPLKKRGKKLGSICTDLWWYCAADKGAFEKRAGKSVEQYQKEYRDTGAWPEIVRAKVKPGTYRTTGRYHLLKKGEPEIFSTIKRIA